MKITISAQEMNALYAAAHAAHTLISYETTATKYRRPSVSLPTKEILASLTTLLPKIAKITGACEITTLTELPKP